MPTLSLVFQVHLPYRLQRYRFFDIGKGAPYLDESLTREILDRYADQAFLAANQQVRSLASRYGDRFGVAFHLSGPLLEQMAAFRPDLLASFRDLARLEQVEMLLSPYYHSFSFLYHREAFYQEVRAHAHALKTLLGTEGSTFCHPGLLYINYLGYWAQDAGIKGVIGAPASSRLEGSPLHRLYHPPHSSKVALHLADNLLAEKALDGFRQGDVPHPGALLAQELKTHYSHSEVITLCLDYSWMGMESGLGRSPSEWLEQLCVNLLEGSDFRMATPRQARLQHEVQGSLDQPGYCTTAGEEAPLEPWRGNALQEEALEKYFALLKIAPASLQQGKWMHLQNADHLAAMALEAPLRPVHSEPFRSGAEAYRHYLHILSDLELALGKER